MARIWLDPSSPYHISFLVPLGGISFQEYWKLSPLEWLEVKRVKTAATVVLMCYKLNYWLELEEVLRVVKYWNKYQMVFWQGCWPLLGGFLSSCSSSKKISKLTELSSSFEAQFLLFSPRFLASWSHKKYLKVKIYLGIFRFFALKIGKTSCGLVQMRSKSKIDQLGPRGFPIKL